MDSEDDLDILTALLEESEGVREEQDSKKQEDDLDGLFDEDNNEEEEYKDGLEGEGQDVESGDSVSELFGDVDDIENEDTKGKKSSRGNSESLDRSKEDLQDELRRMQEQMQRLQQQLEASQNVSSSSQVMTKGSSSGPKPATPKSTTSKLSKPVSGTQMSKTRAVTSAATSVRGESLKLQESSDFLDQLNNADSFKRKPRVAHTPKLSTSPEDRGPLVEIKIGSSFQPLESTSKANPLRSPPASQSKAFSAAPAGQNKPSVPLPLPKDVAVEKYSRLRLRKPRVSSTEMDRKMADRRLIRLSEVPERLTREKLEDSDWVTFAVLVNKVTPQSSSSGKTFSIWKLNDLHNLEVFVSLLLFGEVHKELWKTEPGTVIGLLNPNQMKQKEGYDGVSLTVDHPQKVLLMGEAQDYGTCKAAKKNGDPCSQIVNLFECQFCQYHVKAQYKKMSSKRADLQSSFSGKAPNKVKTKGGGGLRERLCQDGFYYGGVSSAACAASMTASKPNKPAQKTLDKLFVKGSAQHVIQAKRLAVHSGEVSGCSNEFKTLMSAPTPGALQLKKHLTQASQSALKDASGAPIQSISASDLLKQQKQRQQELQGMRQRRAEEIQKRALQNSTGPRSGSLPSLPGRGSLMSPKAASEATHSPTLGRGFSEGEDILFFESSPPSAQPPCPLSLSAAKQAALKKLRAKGTGLEKEDPNAVKRKRRSDSEISARVERNLNTSQDESTNEEEPALKKKREHLQYVQSEEFQKILNAKSLHGAVLQAAEYQLQELYFDALVKKEQMEEKMKGIREMKCRAVTCKKCRYTYFKPADRCREQNHDLHWHDAVKRFFKCPCGQRAIALDRLPHKHCSNCGLFKWERDGMLKEKTGPKLGGELLLPRGEEHGKFLNSMK